MKRSVLILFAAIACFGCNNTTTTTTTTTTFDSTTTIINAPDNRHELFVLDSVLKQYETPMQRFKASMVTPAKIVGAQGTVINVVAADLETVSGKPMGNHIDIELKELTTTDELARDRAATVSDGKLLVSGGAYYINMTSGGEQLKLKAGKTLAVQFPKIAKEEMSLFYGQKDSLGQMNWKGTGTIIGGKSALPNTKTEIVSVDNDSIAMTEGEKKDYAAQKNINTKIYEETRLQGFGWINCDRFLKDNLALTDITIDFDKADTFNYVSVYLLFKDINSVMQLYSPLDGNTFRNIPVGSKVDLLAFTVKEGKVFTAKSKILVSTGKRVAIKLKDTPESEIVNLFKL